MNIHSQKRDLIKRIDLLERRIKSLYGLLGSIFKIEDDTITDIDGNNKGLDAKNNAVQQPKYRNNFGEWLFNDRQRWQRLNRMLDKFVDINPDDHGYKSLTPTPTTIMNAGYNKNPINADNQHVIYQLIFETNEPMLLAGFLSSDMMRLFQNPLFTIIRTSVAMDNDDYHPTMAPKSQEKLIMFIECKKTVETFLKHCHYDPLIGCWQLIINKKLPSINITLERSVY